VDYISAEEINKTIGGIVGYDFSSVSARIDGYNTFMYNAKRAAIKEPVIMAPIMFQIMEDFYNRHTGANINIREIDVSNMLGSFRESIEITAYRQSEKFTVLLTPTGHRKMTIRTSGGRYFESMDKVCDITGIPMPYFIGILDMAKTIQKKYNNISESINARLKGLQKEIWQKEREYSEIAGEIRYLEEKRRSAKVKWPSEIHAACKTVRYRLPDKVYGIGEAKKKYDKKSGVYIALDINGQCMYVGRSANLGNRLSVAREELSGCSVGIVEVDKQEIARAESYFIGLLGPQRNRQGIAV
jgi:hypothetical protein